LCLLGDLLLLLLLLLLFTAIEFSPGGSSPYISTEKTNKNKTLIKETIENHSTNNTKQIMWKNMAEPDRPQIST